MPQPDDLTEVEKALWTGSATGTPVDAAGASVRADVLAALLREEAPGGAAAVHLRGARVTGQLRLAYAEVTHPLLLEECDFDEAPDLYWARMSHTSLAGSRMPGFLGSNVRVDGHLQLSRCVVGDGVRLSGAQISGGLLLADAVLVGGEWALYARRATIDGDLVLSGAQLTGGLALTNARLGGTADLDRVRITAAPHGQAVDADNLAVEAAFYCRWGELQGEVTLRHARVAAALSFSRSALRNPGGVALRASRATLDGGLYLHDGFVAEGQVRVVSARIVRTLRLDGASLRNPGGVAFCADFATIEGMLDGRRGLTVEGETTLLDATVTGPLHLEGAHLRNPGGAALTAHGLTVGALLQLCDGFTAEGRVRLAGAKVGSRICFDDATVRAPGQKVVSCWRVETPELALRWAAAPEGAVDLRYATVGILRDDPRTWPSTLDLDGLRYDVLEPPGEADARLPWLARGPNGFRPQPYEQLATVYQALGDGPGSRTVLLAKQRRQSTVGTWYARVWGGLQDVTVGYGYRPLRAASWLVALLVVGTLLHYRFRPAPVGDAPPAFQPAIYTLDLLLPIVDLGQERSFQPAGGQQWLAYLLIAAGWLLATTIAAGLTRALRRT
ncbi:translocation/assembly module TamB domain-containing protein [Phytohabitans suffuscus]|uniref:oxidoreductase n=1 Tax=Phytohabitans suffuscus TaxID=624315 RepID=UPI0015651170|nr:oxidoreductase [Phytohabitans suffuscus]